MIYCVITKVYLKQNACCFKMYKRNSINRAAKPTELKYNYLHSLKI